MVQNIGSHEGLASSEIFSIFQDSKGFVWIGTNAGFSRYDGYAFENFQYLQKERIGLVYAIRETADRSLWFCTETGLFVLKDEQLIKLRFEKETAHIPFFDLAESSEENLFIGTSKGLIEISRASRDRLLGGQIFSLDSLRSDFWNQLPQSQQQLVRFISINKKGEMLLASLENAFYISGKQIQQIWQRVESSDFISSVYIDSTGFCMWGTALLGINTWYKNELKSYNETNTKGLYGAYGLSRKNDQVIIYSAITVMAYDRNNSGFKPLLSTKNLNIKWPTCSLVDDKGNFWLGSHEGIYYLKKNLFTLFPKESFPKLEEVYTISQLSNDEIVAGTNRGFVYAIREKDAVPVFDGQPVFPKAEVFSIYDDKENHVWFGSGYQGISVISKGKRRNFRVADGLNDNTNYSFLKDSKGQLWSVGDNGITKITVDRAVDTISFEKYHASIPNGMDFKLYNAIEGPDGTLWVGGAPGIFHFDGKKMSRYSFPQNISGDPYVHHLCKDDNGNVWIATTDYGILLCYFDDQHNLRIRKTFSLTDGLLTNTFLCTVLDNRGNLWAASYRGLSCLQLSADGPVRIRNYDYRDGFDLKNYNSLSLFKDRSGKIWVSSSTGVISFDPASLLSQQYSTRVYITSIELLNKNEVIPVYSMNREAEPMKLDADNNSLTVHFTALHYVNPAALRYYYRFGNTDSNWNEVTAGRNISFRQLNHGEYKLHLKASIGGNEYSPVTTFLFSIKPPFWKQHWFIVSALMLAAVLIFLLLLWREKAIREREAQKTELQKLKAISYQHQLEVEQVINYFATSMSDQRTVEDLLWDVSRNCISKLGFEDCVIYINDEKRNMLVQKAAWGPKTTEENKISNPIEIPVGKGIVGSVAANGKAEIINDTGLDSRYIVDDSRRNAEIAVPIVDNGKVIGVIDSESSQKHFYTARHLQILTTLSSLVGDKIVKMQSEQEARSREIQLITLNRDLATSQLTALRAQMNPHFIFNALNSIQQYILKGDVDQANKYLSKFSRLQREVLNNCDQNFISLEKEIQMLNLYLELEQLRFSENFEYRIAIEKEIDTSEIRIPPMILQPFVENAIWHGLMPKTGQRMVSIEFVLQSEDILHCSIRDNGIGRVAAGKLKEEKAYLHSNHKSKGLSLVYERLEILRKQYQQPFEVVISDLSDTGGEVQGTNVSLLLYIGSA